MTDKLITRSRTALVWGAVRGMPLVALALTVGLGAVAPARATVAGSAQASQPVQAPEMRTLFSFEFGEQRRYELGPPDSLAPGELARWSLTLDQLEEDETGATLAVFSFTHDRLERLPGDYFTGNSLVSVVVEGRLKANLAGFPTFVQYTQQFILEGEEMDNSGRRQITYRWDYQGKRYIKEVGVGTRDWDFKVAVPDQRYLDRDAPRGLYMYLPTSLGCLGESNFVCVEQEPALANPGFLSFIVPALEDMVDSEREFLFFMPTALSASPFRIVTAGPWLSNERNQLNNRDRYFDRMKVKLGASGEVEVGPRTMHAWELDMCCGLKRAWVEPGGRVLRVDLETTMSNSDDRWIRLIHGFEEFSSPNVDLDNRQRRQ